MATRATTLDDDYIAVTPAHVVEVLRRELLPVEAAHLQQTLTIARRKALVKIEPDRGHAEQLKIDEVRLEGLVAERKILTDAFNAAVKVADAAAKAEAEAKAAEQAEQG